jgi:hypothetical protein
MEQGMEKTGKLPHLFIPDTNLPKGVQPGVSKGIKPLLKDGHRLPALQLDILETAKRLFQ